MRTYQPVVALVVLVILLLLGRVTSAETGVAANGNLVAPQELIAPAQMGVDGGGNPLYGSLSEWFKAKTGFGSVSADWFGTYHFLADDNRLYISVGRGRPAEFCGAAFGMFDAK